MRTALLLEKYLGAQNWKALSRSREGFFSGAFWSIAGAVFSRSLAIISTIAVARLLDVGRFGEYGLIQSTIATLGIFSGLALNVTATKYVASLRFEDKERVGKILALLWVITLIFSTAVSVLILGFAPVLAAKVLNAKHLATSLIPAAALVFFGAVSALQAGALAGFGEFKTIARTNLLSGVFAFPCIVGGAALWGLNGAILGLLSGMIMNWWLNRHALIRAMERDQIKPIFSSCWTERKIIWEFSLPGLLSCLVVSPVTWYANVLLVNQHNGFAAMGIFNAALQWQSVILFIPASLLSPLLSKLSGESNKNDSNYWKTVNVAFWINGIFAGLAVLAVSCGSYYIMSSYGKAFAGGWPVLVMLCLAGFFIAIIGVVGQIVASSASMWTMFRLNLAWGIIFLFMVLLLVDKHNEYGLAASYLVSYAIHFVVTLVVYANIKRRSLAIVCCG
jgi:O-antigen/teichoic acid export membrane protein